MNELKKQSVWVCWRYETTKDGKQTKIPYNAKTGGKAMSNNRHSWSDYKTAAAAAAESFDGVGLMFADGICGIDIDGADGHTKTNALQAEVLELFKDTYAETSPSGSGIHILFRCDLSRLPTVTNEEGKTKLSPGYYQKNPHNGLECYFSGLTNRYFTFTGKKISKGKEITDRTEEVLYFLNRYMKRQAKAKKAEPEKPSIEETLAVIRNSGNGAKFVALYDDGDLSAYNGDESSADLSLCNILAFYLQGDAAAIDEVFRGSALYRQKWERHDYRNATIQKAITLCGGDYYKGRGRPAKPEEPTDKREDFTPEVLFKFLTSKGVSVSWNDITQASDIYGMEKESSEQLHSNIVAILYSELQGLYRRCNLQTVAAYLDVVASRNRRNPVLELLDGVTYDGRDHLTELYYILNLADDDLLSRVLLKKWLWQCFSLLHNNHKSPFGADGVLVLTGAQGIGKTSFFRTLAIQPQFFKEGVCVDFRDKDSYIQACTCWIAELGEIESTFKSDVERLKAFITNAVDEYRRPYGRDSIRALRRTSLCGTCNSEQFLIDNTGNRRFWTIPVSLIDLEALSRFDSLQLWKQIEAMTSGKLQGFRLTREEQEALADRNRLHEKKMKGETEIEDIMSLTDTAQYRIEQREMTVTEFKSLYADELRTYSAVQIGKVLDKLGYKADVRKVDGRAKRVRLLPKRVYNPYSTG